MGKGTPPAYAACVVLATHRLDVNRTIKGRFGRKSSFAAPDETKALTGHEIGGVTVFGLPADLPVWIDAAVMDRERIVLGGGSRSWKVIAPPSILRTLPNAEVVEGLANPAPPRDEAPPRRRGTGRGIGPAPDRPGDTASPAHLRWAP